MTLEREAERRQGKMDTFLLQQKRPQEVHEQSGGREREKARGERGNREERELYSQSGAGLG